MRLKYRNQVRRARIWKFTRISVVSIITFALVVGFFFANSYVPVWAMNLADIFDSPTRVTSVIYPANTASPTSATIDIQKDFGGKAQVVDKRVFVLDEYFRVNNSPLYGTAQIFVDKCIQYGAPKDCITVAAIARAETDLCKYHNSATYYNCWGFGGGGPNRIYFQNWEQSIDRVYRSLVFSYGERYMLDPRLMERTFCGWEPGCTGWGKRVIFFMDQIDQFSIGLGTGSLYALR